MRKNIVIAGFSKEKREIELEKTKTKYSKKGYTFLDYIDNGTLKSIAIFEVDESIIKKEKSINLMLMGGFFLLLSIILYLKAS